jgi:adenylate kinase family enzyme
MRRIVVLGRGGAGKTTFSAALGRRTGYPVVQLDRLFWQPGLAPTPPDQWAAVQQELTEPDAWILDGDLGRFDVLEPRLAAADTVIILDFPMWRCAWRAVRRSRERADFWRWLIEWRHRWRPVLLTAVHTWAPGAELHILRDPTSVDRFLARPLD